MELTKQHQELYSMLQGAIKSGNLQQNTINTIAIDTVNSIQDREYSEENSKPNFDKWRNYGVSIYNFYRAFQDFGADVTQVLGYEGSGKSYGLKYFDKGELLWFNTDKKNPTWKGGRQVLGTKNRPSTAYNLMQFRSYEDILITVMLYKKLGLFDTNKQTVVFMLGHIEDYNADGETRQRLKVLGNLARNLSIEGIPENTIYTKIKIETEGPKYYFTTVNNGLNTCRTLEGLFENDLIPNNLKLVADAIRNY